MKVWNLKVKSNSQEIIKKLNSSFGSTNGFVLDLENDPKNSVTFKVRKRILYAFQTVLRNHIIAKGKIRHTQTEHETDVEISFRQHFLNKLEVSIFLILGLLAIIFGIIKSNLTTTISGGIFLGIGIVLLLFIQNQFRRNIQEYKKLFNDILES